MELAADPIGRLPQTFGQLVVILAPRGQSLESGDGHQVLAVGGGHSGRGRPRRNGPLGMLPAPEMTPMGEEISGRVSISHGGLFGIVGRHLSPNEQERALSFGTAC